MENVPPANYLNKIASTITVNWHNEVVEIDLGKQ